MSNRAALITIMTEFDAIDDRLRALRAGTSSIRAACQIDAARDCMIHAKMRLAVSLASIDPVIDLVAIAEQAAPCQAGAGA
ncbi:hypothetical protein [Sphingomonas sp. PAMC 26605]|uniref:hypothetical protein n=1 Tax=Sphingomonas sp. PAMC 26605 TaxID=1112214 RepID=UPI00026CAC39|nr:hypothetical protein [Sphingomonas sp. PAMC 26605]